MEIITLPQVVQDELRKRQQDIVALTSEMNLILRIFMSTLENEKIYYLSADLTQLVETEEKETNGESIPIEVPA